MSGTYRPGTLESTCLRSRTFYRNCRKTRRACGRTSAQRRLSRPRNQRSHQYCICLGPDKPATNTGLLVCDRRREPPRHTRPKLQRRAAHLHRRPQEGRPGTSSLGSTGPLQKARLENGEEEERKKGHGDPHRRAGEVSKLCSNFWPRGDTRWRRGPCPGRNASAACAPMTGHILIMHLLPPIAVRIVANAPQKYLGEESCTLP